MPRKRQIAVIAVQTGLAVLGIAAGEAAQAFGTTLTAPATAERAADADGFIRRWLLLEPIPASGLTDGVVRATVMKEYFPNQLTVVPHDGDKVMAGDQELVWHAVETKNYNVNLYHFAHALGKRTTDA